MLILGASDSDSDFASSSYYNTVLFLVPHVCAGFSVQSPRSGCDVDARNLKNCTGLMRSAGSGSTHIVALLLAAGASVFLQDSSGKTALDWARMSRNPEVSTILQAACTKALKKQVLTFFELCSLSAIRAERSCECAYN